MRIFENKGKINFVDENNVLVGFDYSQDCCESFGYLFTGGEPTNIDQKGLKPDKDFDPAAYRFDTYYFRQSGDNECDGTQMATFKLFKTGADFNKKGPRIIFLTLHNTHNGYYGHGFSMTCPHALRYGQEKPLTKTIREGTL